MSHLNFLSLSDKKKITNWNSKLLLDYYPHTMSDLVRDLEAEDTFYPYHTWPQWARMAFVKGHKNRDERFKLFVFFWKNGMEAWRAKRWVMAGGKYDRSAWQSIADAEKLTQTKSGRMYLRRIPMMDLATGRVDRDTNYNE